MLRFNPSKTLYSVGIEHEMFLVQSDSIEQFCNNEELFATDFEQQHSIKGEFFDNTIEVVTPICDNAKQATDFLYKTSRSILTASKKNGCLPIALGLHPSANANSKMISKDHRYQKLLEEFQIILRNYQICGLHFHVGFQSEEQLLKAYNFVLPFTPIFTAFLASSSMIGSFDTGLESYRSKLFEQLPRSGLSYYFKSYEEFTALFHKLKTLEVIDSPNDIWWDLRMRPDFGTLEIRACDSVSDFERIYLACEFFSLLCQLAQTQMPQKLHYEFLNENRWSAIRYGLDGYMLDESQRYSTKQFIHKTLMQLIQKGLCTQDFIEHFMDKLNEDTIARQMVKADSIKQAILKGAFI